MYRGVLNYYDDEFRESIITEENMGGIHMHHEYIAIQEHTHHWKTGKGIVKMIKPHHAVITLTSY